MNENEDGTDRYARIGEQKSEMIDLALAQQAQDDMLEVSTVSNFSKCMYNSQNELITDLSKRFKGKSANTNYGYIDLKGGDQNEESNGSVVPLQRKVIYKLVTIQEVNSMSVSDNFNSNDEYDEDSDYEVDGEESLGRRH